MSAYWLIYGKLSVVMLLACLLLRRAPARWRFRLALIGLATAAIPWSLIPSIEIASPSDFAQWVAPIAETGTLAAATPSAVTPNSVAGWPVFPIAIALGGAVFLLIARRQLLLLRRWRRTSYVSTRLGQGRCEPKPEVRILRASRLAATSGFHRPTIWIGEQLLDDTRLQCIIGHELAHVRQLDYRWVWLITAARCLIWWNPGVWLWAWIARREMEFSCDEACSRRFGSEPYRKALAGLLRERAAPVPLLPFIGRTTFNILRLKRLERNTMSGIRQRLAVILTVLLMPLASIQLVGADDGPPGGTSIVENESGVTVSAEDVPATVFLRMIAGKSGLKTLHVHPSVRGSFANVAVTGSDWETVLPRAIEEMGLAYRIEEESLVVAPVERLQERDWLTEGTRLSGPAGRQIGADVTVIVDGQTGETHRNLLLTEGNWSGFLIDGLRFNVRSLLLSEERVQLEFSILSDGDADESAATPVLITKYGSVAALQMGSTAEDGSEKSLRIEVTPWRL